MPHWSSKSKPTGVEKKLKYETGMYRARAKTSGATKTKDKNICVDDSRRSKRNDEDDKEWGERTTHTQTHRLDKPKDK